MSTFEDSALGPRAANYVPLSPISFLARAAAVHPAKAAILHGDAATDYATLYARCRRLASALGRRGIGRGHTVAVLAPNTPVVLEAHYGVPMAGAVLNALNTRLDPAGIAFCLNHAEARVLLVDRELAPLAAAAVARLECPPLVVDVEDALAPPGERVGALDYEALLAEGDPDFAGGLPGDEWQAIALNYTSGTTGNPKGVVYHHRGAYLNALGDVMLLGLSQRTVYLWTLPMFHCNGWSFTWALSAVAGTHVCLRRVDPAAIFALIEKHGVTHLCGAPIVLNLLVHAPASVRRPLPHPISVMTGGAAPPSTILAGMEAMGFRVLHAYGLTESFGPSSHCAWQAEWEGLDLESRARLQARQGVANVTLEAQAVVEAGTLDPVPADGETVGEILVRGNTVMKGYLRNPAATAEAFAGGWYHTGDLGVLHPDGYVEIKDRAKDIIISGGENISSLEVEEVLYRHPAVLEAAVVARPDPVWGETPCAFVALKPDAPALDAEVLIHWCRDNLARFKAPRSVVFGPLPKTATGKIQKFVLRDRARGLAGDVA